MQQRHVECKVSFWAERFITVKGFEGSVLLDDLECHIYDIGYERICNCELGDDDRGVGAEISKTLNELYTNANRKIANSNFLTRLIHYINEIVRGNFPNTTYSIDQLYNCYTEKDYIENFGKKLDSLGHLKATRMFQNNKGEWLYSPPSTESPV